MIIIPFTVNFVFVLISYANCYIFFNNRQKSATFCNTLVLKKLYDDRTNSKKLSKVEFIERGVIWNMLL